MQEQKQSLAQMPQNTLLLMRVFLGIILTDLFIQFLGGMWLNLFASFPSIASSTGTMMGGFGMQTMMQFMIGGGMSILTLHMMNGYLLFILSIIVLVASLYSKRVALIGLSIGGIASILLAGISGLSFMFSVFQNNLYSYLMSIGFIAAFSTYFAELYFSRR